MVGVDGRDLTHCTLTEAQEVLRRVERSATLTIELVHFNCLADGQLVISYESQFIAYNLKITVMKCLEYT